MAARGCIAPHWATYCTRNIGKTCNVFARCLFSVFTARKNVFVLRPAVGLCRAICRRVPNLCICFACVAMFAFDAVFTGGRRRRLQSAVPRARGKEAMSVRVCAEQRLDGASVSRRSNACLSPARASALSHCRRTRSSLGAGSLVGFQLVPLSLVSPFSLSCSKRICVSFRSAAPSFFLSAGRCHLAASNKPRTTRLKAPQTASVQYGSPFISFLSNVFDCL